MRILALSMLAAIALCVLYWIAPALFTILEWVIVSVIIGTILILAEEYLA